MHCERGLLQIHGEEGVETGGDFIRWLLCFCFIIRQVSWWSRNRHLIGILLFVGKWTQHWFWHMHTSCWFIAWMQRVICPQLNLCLFHWQIQFWGETPLSCVVILPFTLQLWRVTRSMYFSQYTCQNILCHLPGSLPWKENTSLLWFHKEKLHCVSGDHSAFGKLTRVCTGVWGQVRQQNLQSPRKGAGVWQLYGTRLFELIFLYWIYSPKKSDNCDPLFFLYV